jgi:hypothetical protein
MDFYGRGRVGWIPSGPKDHPCVFITEPFEDENNNGELSVMIVTITSVKDEKAKDMTCLLYPGDHEYIVHPSWVYYEKTQIKTCADVDKDIKGGKIKISTDPMREEALMAVYAGIGKSPYISDKMAVAYRFAMIQPLYETLGQPAQQGKTAAQKQQVAQKEEP